MDELMDMIMTDESPSSVSDKIKEILFAKSADKIDSFRPAVAANLFGAEDQEQMKSFKQFISESINISGDFNGNLYMNSDQPDQSSFGEGYTADVLWNGNLYRMELVSETGIPSRQKLG